jgi:hypothetical protein
MLKEVRRRRKARNVGIEPSGIIGGGYDPEKHPEQGFLLAEKLWYQSPTGESLWTEAA